MVQAVILMNEIQSSHGHNNCHVLVENLTVDDTAMKCWEPVVRHTSSTWMTFLKPPHNPLSSPKTFMTFIWEHQRDWKILHRSSARNQGSAIIYISDEVRLFWSEFGLDSITKDKFCSLKLLNVCLCWWDTLYTEWLWGFSQMICVHWSSDFEQKRSPNKKGQIRKV